MKNLIFALLLASASVFAAVNPPTSYVPSASSEFQQNRQMGPVALSTSLGTQLRQAHNTAVGVYDFSVQGGAVSGVKGTGIQLPNKAIVTKVWFDVVSTVSTSASGTLSFKLWPSQGSLKDPLAAASWVGRINGELDGTVGDFIKPAVANSVVAVIGTGALTAGKVKVFVDYVVSE